LTAPRGFDRHVTSQLAKGFSLYVLKDVMGGRGDDLIDLARTNLWQ
jgi:pyruvate dehydrogenase (quinone)